MLKYIIRLDDACPNMNEENWNKVEELLNKYNIKPIVGIIPDNKDSEFNYSYIEDFWKKYAKRWQEKGWIIAQHGLYHKYISKERKTEFAGKDYEEQKKIIEKGYNILKEHDIVPKCFFAPNHTFDNNTIKVCKELSYFEFISDGYAFYPYNLNGMLFIPSVFDTPHKISNDGVFTFVYHPNHITREKLEYLEKFIVENRECFNVDIDEIIGLYRNRRRTVRDCILQLLISVYRKIRKVYKK